MSLLHQDDSIRKPNIEGFISPAGECAQDRFLLT